MYVWIVMRRVKSLAIVSERGERQAPRQNVVWTHNLPGPIHWIAEKHKRSATVGAIQVDLIVSEELLVPRDLVCRFWRKPNCRNVAAFFFG